MNQARKPVAVVVGATSKWQSDGRTTRLAHGRAIDDSDIPVGMRWGVGGAIAQKFAKEGFLVVLTTRRAANASALEKAIVEQGGEPMIVELDLVSRESISRAFAAIRQQAGDPDVLVYNAGYLEGRDLPPDKELLEHVPIEIFETAQHIASRGPFLVAQEVLPGMRKRGAGSFLISNNQFSLRGRKRLTGQSLYYPRVMMRTLAQVLTEEYSEHGVHVANVIIDGLIDSPGTRALPRAQQHPEAVMNPMKIAEAFYYLHTQDRSCWTHELQLTPYSTKPSVWRGRQLEKGVGSFLGIPIGLALSTAAGLRVFVPLLLTGLAARLGYLSLTPSMTWIGSDAALVAFATATVLEVGAYYVPWLDNVLDTVGTPAALTAGVITTAAGTPAPWPPARCAPPAVSP